MTIDEQIKAKKAEIKKANRELSAMQDELKKRKKEKQWYKASLYETFKSVYGYGFLVKSNKPIDTSKVIAAIEALSEKDELEDYVDWSKVPEWYNWAAKDECGKVWVYSEKPKRWDDVWHSVSCSGERVSELALNCDWKSSLRKRPGYEGE